MITCSGGDYPFEVGWSLSCSDGTTLSGGAPYTSSAPLAVALGATCTLNMTDSYGDGWNGAEWAAPGFGQAISLASGFAGTESFEVQLEPQLMPPSPPSPPPLPPGTFTSTASLKTAANEFNANAASAIATYGPIADWDVSAITDMSQIFYNLANFNEDISSWETSGVTNMQYMFYVRPRALPPLLPACTSRVSTFYVSPHLALAGGNVF